MNIERIATTEEIIDLLKEDLVSLQQEKPGPLFLALPGGRSAGYILKAVMALSADVQARINLFLVDERLEGERNEDTLKEAGLQDLLDQGTTFSVVQQSLGDSRHQFDRVYLGVGEDGHVASLFPGSYRELPKTQTTTIDNSPKPPRRRITLTYQGFLNMGRNAKLYLLFLGEGKRDALQRLLSGKEGVETLPCSFFVQPPFHGTIVTDLREN